MVGNRKLAAFIAFTVITAVMRAMGWTEDETYRALNELSLWLFIGANVVEHLGPAAQALLGKFLVKK